MIIDAQNGAELGSLRESQFSGLQVKAIEKPVQNKVIHSFINKGYLLSQLSNLIISYSSQSKLINFDINDPSINKLLNSKNSK